MTILGIGITLLSIVIAYLPFKNGRETKKLLAKMDDTQAQMERNLTNILAQMEHNLTNTLTQMERNLNTTLGQMEQNLSNILAQMEFNAERRQREMAELIAKGFREVHSHIDELH